MPILSVKERPFRRMAQTIRGGVRDHKRHFIIESTSRTETFQTLKAAQDPTTGLKVPQFFDLYPSDLGCICQNVEFEQKEEAPWVYDCYCTYSSKLDVDQEEQQEENPVNRPADIHYGHDRYMRVVHQDITGKAIRNSKYEPYNPPIEIESGRPVITVTKNLATFSGVVAETYQDAINTDTFLGYPPYTVRVMGVQAQRMLENLTYFWSVSWAFAVNRETWKLKVLDAAVDPEDGVVKRLDGAGDWAQPVDSTSYFNEFRVYRELPFSGLNLGV